MARSTQDPDETSGIGITPQKLAATATLYARLEGWLDRYLWLYGCWMDYCAGRLWSKELNALFGQSIPELQIAFEA